MKLVVFGLNHETSGISEREESISKLTRLRIPKARGFVHLITCNRVEVYASVEEDFSFSEMDPTDFLFRYSYAQNQAMAHLLRVASGLNSLALGETQILGQVKSAYQNALKQKTIDSLLHFVFQQVFRVAKSIRTETGITQCPTSIGSIALQLVEQFFGHFRNQKALVIGLGEMGLLTAQLLIKKGIGELIVANRTKEVAENFATRWGVQACPFDSFHEVLSRVDLVITSTASEQYIVSRETLERSFHSRNKGPLVLIDLGSPRDIDPKVGERPQCYLYNIDDLKSIAAKNLSFRKREALIAEEKIQKAVENFEKQWGERQKFPRLPNLIQHTG